MKKILYLISVIFLFSSCKDYFDQIPKIEMSVQNTYTKYDGALRNLSVLYARLGNADQGLNGSERFVLPSVVTSIPVSTLKLNSQSDIPRGLWKKHYAYIAQANIILDNLNTYKDAINNTYKNSSLDHFTMIGEPANQLIGEARFLRAYAYFNLYRYFGGVPLILKNMGPHPAYVPRATRQEMFKFLYEEMDFALNNCVDNNSGISEGRVTRGAVAAFLAKMKIFHASYIKRAMEYGDKLNETADDINIKQLYIEGAQLCDDIISGKYGSYKLEEYYPAVFTKRNKEVIFSVFAEDGQSTGNMIPMGFDGVRKHGAANGPFLTSWMTLLYDIPMWKHSYRLKEVSRDYGNGIDVLNRDYRKPGTLPNDLINLYETTKQYTITGDTTRRMWVSVKGWVTGPSEGNAPKGLWVFEPIGRYLGPEFYIEPGFYDDYTSEQNRVIEKALETHERVTWRSQTNGLDKPDLWHINWWRLGKFRNLNPWLLNETFEIETAGVDYPLIRLAEIYLLKAEALLMQNKKIEAIRTINIIRDRACNQSTIRDMFLMQGDAPYTYIQGSVMPVPESISEYEALKELLYERLRELVAEDDCGWMDVTRYPDIALEDFYDIGTFRDPLHGMFNFIDPAEDKHIWDLFNKDMIYKILLPIPFTEFSYFPEMKQNPGYL